MESSTRIPGIRPLHVFEACGRHRSFAKAALELAITPGAVSQQIKSLEEELGIELFRRKARGVELTPEGERYFIDVRRSFDLLGDATRRIMRAEGPSEITISVESSLAQNWLIPRLPDFFGRHPQIVLHVAARPLPRNEATRFSDIAIAYGWRSYVGLKVVELMTEQIMPVCSPALLARVGPFDGPDWFRRVVLIHDHTFGSQGLMPDWQGWFETVGYLDLPTESGVSFASSALCLAFAAAGGGVALGRSRLLEPLLADGKLVNPTGMATPSPSPYFLVGSGVLVDTPAVRALVKWLFEAAGSAAPVVAEALS